MRVSIARDEEDMNKNLSIHQIGSVSPYIGLFGTILIMGSFQGLSDATQATINAVAPGISEALIATAMGLCSIPAVYFNRFTSKADSYLQTTSNFAETSIFYRESVKQKDIYRLGRRKKLHAEINVVPYIDVMLVLLIIFMVLSPLLIQGIDVNLPRTDTTKMTIQMSLVVSIDENGNYFLNLGDEEIPFLLMSSKIRHLLFLMQTRKLR